ncbi:MAG: hypothetical protein GX076_05645 [Clostridiales bacterium]|nr:hypothetical protein [Clostridiales bacterium]
MNRKVLVCVLACCLLFLGMGYAYWTDSLQIDTTATTGELDVRFVDVALFGQYADEDGWAIFDGIDDGKFKIDTDRWKNRPNSYNRIAEQEDLEAYMARIEGYTTTAFDAKLVNPVNLGKKIGDNDYVPTTWSSDKIEISVTDMYPGYGMLFRADIVNPGTLAAKLSQLKIDLTKNMNDAMKNMICVSFEVLRDNSESVVFDFSDEVDDSDIFVIDGVKFIRLSAIGEGLKFDINEEDVDNLLCIYPANADLPKDSFRMDLILGVAMDPDAEGVYTTGSVEKGNPYNNKDSATQLKTAKFAIQFLWDQFNTPVDKVDPV